MHGRSRELGDRVVSDDDNGDDGGGGGDGDDSDSKRDGGRGRYFWAQCGSAAG